MGMTTCLIAFCPCLIRDDTPEGMDPKMRKDMNEWPDVPPPKRKSLFASVRSSATKALERYRLLAAGNPTPTRWVLDGAFRAVIRNNVVLIRFCERDLLSFLSEKY